MKTMKTRLNYMGGSNQQARMNVDKERSLRKALLYSYQAATAILSDGREFRCLINPNKISLDLDNKILSIPFKDICLNGVNPPDRPADDLYWEDLESLLPPYYPDEDEDGKHDTTTQGLQEIGIKEGDVFEWKENNSHWLVYLRRLEETAYFRAEIRRCRYQVTLDNGSKYWIYVRGPVEQSMVWGQSESAYYNKLNYSLVMYITQNEETLNYFHRFTKININGQPWEVQATDSLSTPGILEISLKETFKNTPESDIDKAVQDSIDIIKVDEKEETYIHGLSKVYPYDVRQYEIVNHSGDPGIWKIINESRKNIVKMQNISSVDVTLNIITGKTGKFTLAYVNENDLPIATLDIEIGSL